MREVVEIVESTRYLGGIMTHSPEGFWENGRLYDEDEERWANTWAELMTLASEVLNASKRS